MKYPIQWSISLPFDASLRPILASHYDRFSPRMVGNSQPPENPIQGSYVRVRGSKPEFNRFTQFMPNDKATHPEGGIVYSHNQLVSDSQISRALYDIGTQIVARCSTMGLSDINVFLRHEGSVFEYYVADHSAGSLVWINRQRPSALEGLADSHIENTLREEYWAHMEAFPGPHPASANNIIRLKSTLSSLAFDSATSEGSTSPFSYEQLQDFLCLLNSFDETNTDEYQTFAVARIWNMIWHARVINNYGSRDACLDRFSVLSDNPPSFTGSNTILALATFGIAENHLARCSRAWAGRIAYVGEWGQFKSKNETEWQQVIERACVILIASLSLFNNCGSKMATIVPTLTSLLAAAYAHHLVTESQNLGNQATEASVYFQAWEKPDYNVQRIALRNSVPQVLLLWAFVAFVCSLLQLV